MPPRLCKKSRRKPDRCFMVDCCVLIINASDVAVVYICNEKVC